MLLRILTTFFLVFGLILAMAFPWVFKARPHTGGRIAMEHYLVFSGTYLILTVLSFVAAAICAIVMVRQVRIAYRAQTRQNLEELVESSLRQHQKSNAKDQNS